LTVLAGRATLQQLGARRVRRARGW